MKFFPFTEQGIKITFVGLLILVFIFINFTGCSKKPQNEIRVLDEVVHSVSDQEAVDNAESIQGEVAPTIHEDFNISLWASEKLLGDPIQLYFDNQNRAWVSTTTRRRTSVPDIRSHRDWMIETLSWLTVEDRRSFLRKELAPERSDENTWLHDYNQDGNHDWRDLKVEKEPLYLLEDLTGSGYANNSRVMNWDFYDEVTDVAGAVMYHDGDIFLGLPPDVWRIQDTNGDGIWDNPVSISHGYGVHIGFGGHGMSGLTTGPDGRIYWSIGDVGLNVVDQEGKRWAYPRHGAILRSEPDGSNFEVFASGLRNTHEFTFDKYGNLITVDNDGDHAAEFERLVYLVDGSDSGWRINWQFGKYNDPKNNSYKVLMDEEYYRPRFEDQAAHILPPIAPYHSGPAGMTYNPGTALNEDWKDHFFITSFRGSPSRSGIYAFTLKPSGASFELETDQMILEGVLATGLDISPDGALYIADWIEGWAPDGNGRIWKMDTPEDSDSALRLETKRLLGEDFTDRDSRELADLLGHADMRVRQKAQFELARRDDTASLLSTLERSDHRLARIHGAWGLGQIGRRNTDAVAPLIGFLKDDDDEVRAQSARMLGDVRYEPAADALVGRLGDDSARVRFFAAEALGRIAWRPAFEPLVGMLEANDDKDVYLRHGGAIALERIGDAEAVTGLADHPSRAVRIAAVVALYRLGHPGVARFLNDEDEFIVTNAARAISDEDFITEALEDLAALLEQDRFTNEPLVRRAINANLYVGGEQGAGRLARFALRPDISEPLRVEALNTLEVWADASVLDRVTGVYRGVPDNDPADARRALDPVLADLFGSRETTVKIAAIQAAGNLGHDRATASLRILASDDPSEQVRMASLNALTDLEYDRIEEVIFRGLDDSDPAVRMNALSVIPSLGLPARTTVNLVETVLENGSVSERQSGLQTLAMVDSPAAHAALDRQMDRLQAGDVAAEVKLELVQAIESANSPRLQERLEAYQSVKDPHDPVARYEESLYGGNADRGQRIFFGHEGAQCIRCHVVGAEGSEVGPDLTAVGTRLTRRQLLQAQVDPHARIAPGYGTVTLTLDDGQRVQGVLAAESDTHITVSRGEQQWQLAKSDIVERVNSPSSMPNMEGILSRRELRDVVEYLSTLNGLKE